MSINKPTVFDVNDINELYLPMLKHIKVYGKSVSPRGKKTHELHRVLTTIHSPRKRILTCYGRYSNPFFMTAEILWILDGRAGVDWIRYYNKQMEQYADKGYKFFHGSYGQRMRRYGQEVGETMDQLEEVYNLLKKDPDTRRAVMTFWDPVRDYRESNDIPCNNLSMFKLRDGYLHLTQIIRSNDVTLGLTGVNIFQFSVILEVLSGFLDVEVGTLTFLSDSLHSYDDQKIEEKVLKENKTLDLYKYVESTDARISKEQFDKELDQIMVYEQKYREGIFSSIHIPTNPFWHDLSRMTLIWSLRKHGYRQEAIKHARKLKTDDLLVVVFEYLYRNSKNGNESRIIENFANEKFRRKPEVMRYIKHGGKGKNN